MPELHIEVEYEAAAVHVDRLRELLDRGLEDVAPGIRGAATLVLSDDARLQELNREFRDIDAPTDVLSFPASESADDDDFAPPDALLDSSGGPEGGPAMAGSETDAMVNADDDADYLGDVILSLPAVEREAATRGMDAFDELAHSALHGLLHLLGHDHEEAGEAAEMHALEERVLGPGIHDDRMHDD